MSRPFSSAKGVAFETIPGPPPLSFLTFSASSTDNKDASHYGKHLSLFEFLCEMSSLTVYVAVR